MKKKIFTLVATVLLIMSLTLVLVSCNNEKAGNKLIGFELDEVEKVILETSFGSSKEYRGDYADQIYAKLTTAVYVKNSEKKHTADYVNDSYSVKFYLKNVEGYFEVILNAGMRKMENFKHKKVEEGFFDIKDNQVIVKFFNEIFYLNNIQ